MSHNTRKETNNSMCTLTYEFTCNICTLRYEYNCNVSAKFTFFLGFINVRTKQSMLLEKKQYSVLVHSMLPAKTEHV